ncbi:MAG: glycosyltransferase family 2 protein [Candidatus Taylorbacteria bacterium]|nr:glycosyltransferase family 2 protein [Candidatus Taylorbacteria bacterium]
MAKKELTIVIPTYNEGDIIESSLRRISRALGNTCSQTEVIMADDGKDDLPLVIERLSNSFGFATVRVMRNTIPLGKGESTRTAFNASVGEIVGFIDVDLSVDPSFIHAAVQKIKDGNDICIASRIGNRWKSDKSLLTSLTATIFRSIHRNLLFGREKSFTDTQCGFKFFKREIALNLFKDLVATDGLTDLEILLKAVQSRYKISEIKVPRINDREGKRKLSRIFANETLSLCKIFCKYKLGFKIRASSQ